MQAMAKTMLMSMAKTMMKLKLTTEIEAQAELKVVEEDQVMERDGSEPQSKVQI